MDKRIIFLLLFLPFVAKGQTYLDCAPEGPLLELQLNTEIANDKFFYSNGSCIKGGVTNGGLELIAGTLSIIDGDTIGQVLRWTGTTWEPRLIIFHGGGGGVDTVYNGLTDRDTAFVWGGPQTEHTRVHGQKAYNLTLDDMMNINLEAQRTGGTAFTEFRMGSSAAQGFDISHYNEADNTKQSVIAANYSTGNVFKIQGSATNGAYFQQYDNGGGLYQWDLTASDGSASKILRGNKNALYALYLDNLNISHEAAFVMVDTFTGELRRKSPADFAGLYGDNWGSQTVSSTARFSGNGTSGSPLELAQQSATTGQVMKWNGTSWAPGTDSANAPDSTFAKGNTGAPSYAGKTISSNVFRNAKTSFRTDDTTGVVTINQADTANLSPHLRFNGNGEYIWQVKKDTRSTTGTNLNLTRKYGQSGDGNFNNQIFSIGWNVAPGGGLENSAYPSAAYRIEEKYKSGSLPFAWECHLPHIEFINNFGGRRPMSGYFARDTNDATRFGHWSFESDFFVFKNYHDAIYKGHLSFNSNSGYTPGLTLIDTSHIRVAHIGGYWQRNSTNSAYISLIRADATNRVLLGGQAETGIAAYNDLTITNSGYLSNENGAIQVGKAGARTALLIDAPTAVVNRWGVGGVPYIDQRVDANNWSVQSVGIGTTPFSLNHSAPESSFALKSTGRLGLGTYSPAARLHIVTTEGNADPVFRIQNATGTNNIFRTSALPEGVISANTGDLALASVSGAGSLWVKQSSGGTSSGWVGATIGSGTTNYMPKWTSATSLGNSLVYDDGTSVGINSGTFLTAGKLEVNKTYSNTTDANAVLTGNIPLLTWRTSSNRFALGNGYHASSILSLLGGGNANPTTALMKWDVGGDVTMDGSKFEATNGKVIAGGAGSSFGSVSPPSAADFYVAISGGKRYRVQAASGLAYIDWWNAPTGSNRNFTWATSYFSAGQLSLLQSSTAGGTPSTNLVTFDFDGDMGVKTSTPAQTFHVEGTARITGSDGTATTIMGRDGDGDVSSVSLGSSLELASGTLNLADLSTPVGTFGTHNKFVEIDVNAKGQITDIVETAFNITTYASSGGTTTTTLQHDDYIVEADPTAGDLYIQLGSQENGRVYHIFGCCNLTNDIILQGSGMKFTGAYGTTSSDYTFGPGEHLEIIYRSSNSTYYISKK